ncbi:6078_t:CDS:2 [Funneliformis mosseae]|uniref:6078_t:CDS:1 n=1 Tax=Funneliformis mosseae TaxID=27381 RepID=A0A9N9DQK5_FUNMO|nr:6078_t:CDS:2 [Funneliformis mosseae]
MVTCESVKMLILALISEIKIVVKTATNSAKEEDNTELLKLERELSV